jgi:hypothetical protein
MSVDRNSFSAGSRSRIPPAVPFAANIPGKGSYFDPSMNSCFLEGLQRCRLGVGQPRFSAALGESPASAAARANQQELDAAAADPIANRGDVFTLPNFPKMR